MPNKPDHPSQEHCNDGLADDVFKRWTEGRGSYRLWRARAATKKPEKLFKDKDVKRVLVGAHRLFTLYDAICQRFTEFDLTLGHQCFLARYNVIGFYIDSKGDDLSFLDMKLELLQQEVLDQIYAIFPTLDDKRLYGEPKSETSAKIRKQRKEKNNWPLPDEVEEEYFGIPFIPYNGHEVITYKRWPILFEQLLNLLSNAKPIDKNNAAT
ncbi:hypothetical protein M3Y97_00995200 [Aphelenchoides bicaudatus]|nr:hypothetical protein M3Y97_00995200 [Aphelenchoides bicaudatus]